MSTQRFAETRAFRDDNTYDVPFTQRTPLPIHSSVGGSSFNPNQQLAQDRIRHQDTSVQWVNDPVSGAEKFRVTINIDGFNQNEVNIRVDGNKLVVFGEHVENKDQGTAKKVIEKSYELPHDIERSSPQVTFPTGTTMQVDFPSRHSNVIYDDGRTPSKSSSHHETSHRSPARLTQEKSSSEFTSTRKLGSGATPYNRNASPRSHTSYDDVYAANDLNRGGSYSSTSNYHHAAPSFPAMNHSNISPASNSTYSYRGSDNGPSTRSPYGSSNLGDIGQVKEQSFSETRRETHHRRSSPTSGVQSSREFEHHRSGSPSIATSLDQDRFRSNISQGNHSVISPSRNVEVREFTRRVGNNGDTHNEPALFAQGFNADAFYRSAFQPEILTDEHGQKRVEMKLDVNNYQPNEIKVSVNGKDLVVQAEHNDERPPTSSSRAYFFKQITLPPNADLGSLASQYHPDGKLHITAKLTNDQASVNYH